MGSARERMECRQLGHSREVRGVGHERHGASRVIVLPRRQMALTNWFAAALALIAPDTVDFTASFHVDCAIPPHLEDTLMPIGKIVPSSAGERKAIGGAGSSARPTSTPTNPTVTAANSLTIARARQSRARLEATT
jgi:hypothetical protein